MNFTEDELVEFRTEAEDLLSLGEESLLKYEKGISFRATYDSVFRIFHSLKGGAGMLGLGPLQEHMHKVENQLSEMKERSSFSKPEISFFLKAIDLARKILAGQNIDFDYTIPSEDSSEPAPPNASAHDSLPGVPPQPPEMPNRPHVQNSIYIVDDDPSVLEVAHEILSSVGMATKLFSEPEKLLEELKISKPDLVLTDVKMPAMNGLELNRAVKKIDPELPVVIISGHLSREALLDAINNGVFASVEKPFQEEILITYCLTAAKQYSLTKALNRSMNLLLYQFADLDDFLKSQGKDELRRTIQQEIDSLLEIRRLVKKTNLRVMEAPAWNKS